MNRALIALTVSVVALAATGCGSSSTTTGSSGTVSTQASTASQASVTKTGTSASTQASSSGSDTAAQINQINAICGESVHALAGPTATIENEDEFRKAALQRAAIEQKALSKLSGLKLPPTAPWPQFMARRRTLIKAWLAVGHRGLVGSYFETAQRDHGEMLAAAKQLGLEACASEGN